MRTRSLSALTLILGAFAAGCDQPEEKDTTCTYDGVEREVGDSFPSTDGCNTCSCGEDGAVACTTRACVVTCTYDGVVHETGSTFPATDGCNTCTCGEGGEVACTEMACVETCTYGDSTYETGESFPAGDGCNTCSCSEGGQVACTAMACPPVTCTYDRQTWNPGDSFPAIDGCNTCTCGADGDIVCTDMACPQTCTYDRREWAIGDSFPAIDGCNTCTCMVGGQIACTEMACVCDPASEWWRQYFGHSPDECAAIDFRCLEWTVMFDNECGCGCEHEKKDCEREIDCFFPECDNLNELRVQCPYSTIDTTRDCTDELACPPDDGFCHRPDQDMGCGICMNPPEEETCEGDGACQAGTICEPLRCACAGQRVCVPGCTGDAECGEGEMCGAGGRCEARRCDADRACPAGFRCDGGGCLRMSCGTDADCQGFCVGGLCYSEPGNCLLPPP